MPRVFEALKKLKDDLPGILTSKPWITEEEGKDAYDRIDETTKWLESMVEKQMEKELN